MKHNYSSTMSVIQISLAFTRYLYQMIEVKQSLFIAMLDHNPEEALFWTYELYYSGFEEEVYNYVLTIYNTIYKKQNPSLHANFHAKHTKWQDGLSDGTDIGSIVYTLALRPYCLVDFTRKYLYANIESHDTTINDTHFIVSLTPEYISQYATHDPHSASDIHRCRVLESVGKYSICKEYNRLFNTITYTDFADVFTQKWLYYASFSTIWENRIVLHNGLIDYDAETVTFANEEDEEAFRSTWDYEPDEVSHTVFTRRCGTGNETMLSVKDFCERYNYTIKSRIVKRKPTAENLTQNDT